jgi:myo-inositol 2-dehydrogenase/D-chiro-inositol 1-dehydrogenase
MNRRSLFSIAGTAAGLTILNGTRAAAQQAPSGTPKLKVGFAGCGGRGSFVADIFKEDGGYEFAAAMDYFDDRAQSFGEKFGVPADKRFSGLGGFQKLLGSGIDAVAIHSPAYFHPDQCAQALEAGKHVFVAKPVAVDVPGSLTIGELGRLATAKKLVMLVDFQSRGNAVFTEALTRVRRGVMGELTYGECIYEYGTLTAQVAEEKTVEDRLRNWVQYKDLSGDICVEQNIHSLDIAAWAWGPPLRATGTGSRRVKTGPGDTSDHYNVLFEYAGGGSVAFMSRQYNAWGAPIGVIKNRYFGTKGALETDFGGLVNLRAEKAGDVFRGKTDGLYKEGSVQQVRVFRESINGGKFENPTVPNAVETNLLCLFARFAAEQKRTVTWEELLKDTRRAQPDLAGLKV